MHETKFNLSWNNLIKLNMQYLYETTVLGLRLLPLLTCFFHEMHEMNDLLISWKVTLKMKGRPCVMQPDHCPSVLGQEARGQITILIQFPGSRSLEWKRLHFHYAPWRCSHTGRDHPAHPKCHTPTVATFHAFHHQAQSPFRFVDIHQSSYSWMVHTQKELLTGEFSSRAQMNCSRKYQNQLSRATMCWQSWVLLNGKLDFCRIPLNSHQLLERVTIVCSQGTTSFSSSFLACAS